MLGGRRERAPAEAVSDFGGTAAPGPCHPTGIHTQGGVTVSRLMLCGVMSWLAIGPAAPLRADDAEDKAVALVEGLGGKTTRDPKRSGKPA